MLLLRFGFRLGCVKDSDGRQQDVDVILLAVAAALYQQHLRGRDLRYLLDQLQQQQQQQQQ